MSLDAVMRAAELAVSAIGRPGLEGLELTPIDQEALRGPLLLLASRIVQIQRQPVPDRSEWGHAQAALTMGKAALAEPEKNAPGFRILLWSTLRHGRGLSRRTFAVLADLYDASQAGRPHWQLRGRSPVKILGDAELGAAGELEFSPAHYGAVASPAARILALAGYEAVDQG